MNRTVWPNLIVKNYNHNSHPSPISY